MHTSRTPLSHEGSDLGNAARSQEKQKVLENCQKLGKKHGTYFLMGLSESAHPTETLIFDFYGKNHEIIHCHD